MGDFNFKIRKARETNKQAMGGEGTDETNYNGEMLLFVFLNNRMDIRGTLFPPQTKKFIK